MKRQAKVFIYKASDKGILSILNRFDSVYNRILHFFKFSILLTLKLMWGKTLLMKKFNNLPQVLRMLLNANASLRFLECSTELGFSYEHYSGQVKI